MENIAQQVASALLEIKAVKLNTVQAFTWASGWKSPIYCDNRKTLSFPAVRKLIAKSFAEQIKKQYPDVEVIAGVATGAIAHGVLVAEEMNLPFIYVRSAPKGHGLENLIEGNFVPKSKVVVIEDLISTGGSSIAAVEALRKAGAHVLGLKAIFTYEFEQARKNFKDINCELTTLSTYSVLLDQAVRKGYIKEDEVERLAEWRIAPDKYR